MLLLYEWRAAIEGHVLIDGGYPETAPLVIGSIKKLDPAAPLVDRAGYLRYIDNAEQRFRKQLAAQQRRR